jgi:hypothetical protein
MANRKVKHSLATEPSVMAFQNLCQSDGVVKADLSRKLAQLICAGRLIGRLLISLLKKT